MIDGKTRLLAVIADPVAQVRAPAMINDYCRSHGIDAVMVPVHVPARDLERVVAGLRAIRNLDGFIATVPHKTRMAALCDELNAAGSAVGAVNTVRREADGRLIGDMFDGTGFVAGLRAQGHDPAGQRVLLLGAGGAASAIAFALARAGASRVTIANRTAEKARALAARVAAAFPHARVEAGPADTADCSMIINATALGMKPDDPLPIDPGLLHPGSLVCEIVMQPQMTALLQQALERGCAIHLGRHMLEQQLELMAGFMMPASG